MTAIISDVEKFKHIDPQQVETYLRSHGWHQQQLRGDKASIWTLDDFEILLPLKPEIVDFPRRMQEVLETLALAENRSQINIFSSLITNAPNITIQGLVTQIETPLADKLSGEITLFGVVVDQLRKIKTQLSDHDYILAIKAYQERLPVIFTGDLIKENNTFILKNSRNLQLDNI
ncbi:MAG: hypothetical protein SAK29_42010 [Scytonema sp. PMC 1069.18]|nr:hypothetical protein [Scytonema sp. PMC 1069.18]MEC4881364.1 hypothetical protein [Scytonema sp. PMC 1070.18]